MPGTSQRNNTRVLIHWESCLQGLEIPAIEPARLVPTRTTGLQAQTTMTVVPQELKSQTRKAKIAREAKAMPPKRRLPPPSAIKLAELESRRLQGRSQAARVGRVAGGRSVLRDPYEITTCYPRPERPGPPGPTRVTAPHLCCLGHQCTLL